jgi:hypothetical protein
MFAAAVLAADLSTTLDLSARSEVRLRSTQSPGVTTPLGVDLLEQPVARVLASDRRWNLTLGYSAQLLLPDVEMGLAPLVLQTGTVGAAWHDRRLRLSITEDAVYGLQNTAYLLSTQPTQGTQPAQPAPGQPPAVTTLSTAAPATFLFGSTRTYGSASYRFDRSTTLTVGAEYFLSGGLDAASQATLPEQTGERALATFEHVVTRSDTLVTALNAQRADFTLTPCIPPGGQLIDPSILCQPSDQVAQGIERLRHALSRSETVTLGAGAAVSAIREHADVAYHVAYYPVADAVYVRQLDSAGSSVSVTARLAPYIDPRTGVVLNALIGDLSLVDRLSGPLTLNASVGGSQNLPAGDPAAASIARGDVSFDYRLNRYLLLTVGERAFWQTTNGLGSFATALGYVAVTVREPTLHL